MNSKITEKLVINGMDDVVIFDGIDFTKKAYVEIVNATEVIIRNCRIYGIEGTGSSQDYWLKVASDIEVKIVIEDCFFGANAKSVYNLIEPHCYIKDGSSFSNNYFTADSCNHNYINIYGAVEGAEITIKENIFEESDGSVRIGTKGEPKCRINFVRNTVLADRLNAGKWTGLVCVQPFGNATSTFKNMTIVMDGNECVNEQQIYAYYVASSMILDKTMMPIVIIDGKISDVIILN